MNDVSFIDYKYIYEHDKTRKKTNAGPVTW